MRSKQTNASRQKAEKQNVIIETPRGSRNKYKYDENTGRIKFSKILPEGMMFPYDFGFIPNTKAQDGDPLDVLGAERRTNVPGL